MTTIAFMHFVGPMHFVALFILLLIVGGAIGIFFLGRATAATGGPASDPGSFGPTDADLERRRKALELDRMAIENEERRGKLNQ